MFRATAAVCSQFLSITAQQYKTYNPSTISHRVSCIATILPPWIQAQSLSLADTTIIYRIYISLLFILKLFITKCTLGNKKIQTTVVNKNIQVI